MPTIHLSRSERASLQKLSEGPCQLGEIPADHEEKFINYDLIRKQVLLLTITPLGQVELLRQRFRIRSHPWTDSARDGSSSLRRNPGINGPSHENV